MSRKKLDKLTQEELQKTQVLNLKDVQDTAAFEDALKNQTNYTIDEIFVQDRLLWKIAK